jgi:Fe-S-cluster containining protein
LSDRQRKAADAAGEASDERLVAHRQLDREPLSCTTCAACCCRLEVLLISDTGVPHRYIEEDRWGSQVMRRLDDGWCAALDRDSMRCTIYANRPLICREFELGSADCLDEREGSATAYR